MEFACSLASSESDESFIRSLYDLADKSQLKPCCKNMTIMDRTVIGILDKDLSKDLQLIADLDLEKAIAKARQSELVKSQVQVQTAAASSMPTPGSIKKEVEEIRRRNPGYRNPKVSEEAQQVPTL
ncbi:hypothetical protein SNE40_009635 [Patella caerulea]|uniref:Uncharacterized protein n=1 Tax=Patella caerulea TaxID=87958 RepID=A0AAN8PQI8_PATCE